MLDVAYATVINSAVTWTKNTPPYSQQTHQFNNRKMPDVFFYMRLNISSYILNILLYHYVIPSGHLQQAVNNTGYTSHYLWFFMKTMSRWRTALSRNPHAMPPFDRVKNNKIADFLLWPFTWISLQVFLDFIGEEICVQLSKNYNILFFKLTNLAKSARLKWRC